MKRNRVINILVHIILWIGFGSLAFYVPSVFMETKDALMLSLGSILISVFVFYSNAYLLMPRYFVKGGYLKYGIGVIILITCSVLFHQYTGRLVRNKYWEELPPKERYAHNPDEKDSIQFHRDKRISEFPPPIFRKSNPDFRRIHMRSGAISAILILFISTLFGVYFESRGRKQLELKLVNQNLISEMKFLKSQMNPHFLFNALNNIYSLSMLHSVKTPDMVLKLSAMLRYVLYESEDVKVKLGKEVDYIKNFIEFQRIKIEGIPNLHIDIDRADRMTMIEPMLLIPFIENSFKHSKIEDTDKGWISIVLTTNKKTIDFDIKNSIPNQKAATSKDGGIGIENVKRRLKYLYPNKHIIGIFREPKEYHVKLQIFLS